MGIKKAIRRAGRVTVMVLAASAPIAAQNLPQGWQHVESKEGRFSITMPGTPQEKIITDSGVRTHLFWCNDLSEAANVTVADAPDEPADRGLKNLLQSFMTEDHINRVEDFQFDGYTGRRIEGTPSDGFGSLTVVAVAVGHRFYLLVFTTKEPIENMTDAPVFFSSFRFSDSGKACEFHYDTVDLRPSCRR